MEKLIKPDETYTDVSGILGGITGILRGSDGAFIPIDENNSDYQTFLKWIESNAK